MDKVNGGRGGGRGKVERVKGVQGGTRERLRWSGSARWDKGKAERVKGGGGVVGGDGWRGLKGEQRGGRGKVERVREVKMGHTLSE